MRTLKGLYGRLEFVVILIGAAFAGIIVGDILRWFGFAQKTAVGFSIAVMVLLYFFVAGFFLYAYFKRDFVNSTKKRSERSGE